MERTSLEGEEETPTEALLRENIEHLLTQRRIERKDFAKQLGRGVSWLSKRLSGKPSPLGSRFQFSDLDAMARIFELSPADLLQPGLGKWDRRTGKERRSGWERRRQQFVGLPAKPPTDNQ